MLVQIYESHHQTLINVSLMTKIIFSEEFKSLSKELEKVYKFRGINKPEYEAFQDALYCCISQQEDISFLAHSV